MALVKGLHGCLWALALPAWKLETRGGIHSVDIVRVGIISPLSRSLLSFFIFLA